MKSLKTNAKNLIKRINIFWESDQNWMVGNQWNQKAKKHDTSHVC